MQPRIDFFNDVETESRADLKAVGGVKYANDFSTAPTLLTYCFGRTGAIKYWKKGTPIPEEIVDVALHPEKYNFIAWNAAFDIMIWHVCFARLIPGLKRFPVNQVIDAAAQSCYFRTGASLESAAKMHNLPHTKDKIGRVLMLKTCKPQRDGTFYQMTDVEWVDFIRYGLMDTRLLRDIYYRLPPLPPSEQFAYEWTLRRNLRGIRVDTELVAEMDSIIKETMPKMIAEFDHLVGYKFKMNSPVKAKEWFKQYYPFIENLQADTVREMLLYDKRVPDYVRRALEIKDLAGSTSIAKIETAIDQTFMGRIYGVLAYSYTQTKRWAGRGIQVQNFPRPDEKKADSLKFDMNVKDLASVVRSKRPHLQDPIGFVKNLLRRIWIPAEGNTFYSGDLSKVEPSVLFWLMGYGPIPKNWYEQMAAEIYGKEPEEIGKESEERQVGKTADLSCIYGTGWFGFQTALFKTTGIRMEEKDCRDVIWKFRNKYPEIVQFWRDLEAAFRLAMERYENVEKVWTNNDGTKEVYYEKVLRQGITTKLCDGKIYVQPMTAPWKGVQIRLPSGGHLFYHGAREEMETFWDEVPDKFDVDHYGNKKLIAKGYRVQRTRMVLTYVNDMGQGNIAREKVYGGVLCENVVSATAREILVPIVWRLENAGFDVLNLVHDEVWGEAGPGREKEFEQLMCVNPSWIDMKIGAEVKGGNRYLK